MRKAKRLILTRSEKDSLAIAAKLPQASVWVWPAFQFAKPQNASLVRERLKDLSDTQAVLLVSPTAVSFARDYIEKWPSSVAACCVGEATADAVRKAWGTSVQIISPSGGTSESGSEALFSQMKKNGLVRSVLILRAQSGREWMAQRLQEEGVRVEKLGVYERIPLELDEKKKLELIRAMQEETPVLLVTSTEAVGVLKRAFSSVSGAFEWLRSGSAVTIHPRCRQALLQEGFLHAELAEQSNAEAVAHCLSAALSD